LSSDLKIKDSFFDLLYQIFDDTGLIIFDPQDYEVKKLLIPIFKKELTNYKSHTKDLLIISGDLDENYHAQVKIKPINLFFSDETGRHLIEPIDDEYRLKGKRKRMSKEEILNTVENHPEKFSANVLLRPICEDYLFPTGFYIGGPGEISYYAQAIPLYSHYNLQHPIIYPRASATILERNIAKILVKYNISTNDFIKGSESLKETVISSLTDNSKSKMLNQLKVLKEKSLKAQENKFDSSLRQISKAQNLLYPNNNLQERELCIINFVNKYGFDFLDWLYNELDILEFKHLKFIYSPV